MASCVRMVLCWGNGSIGTYSLKANKWISLLKISSYVPLLNEWNCFKIEWLRNRFERVKMIDKEKLHFEWIFLSFPLFEIFFLIPLIEIEIYSFRSGQVRYGGIPEAARRRVHLATVLPRPPFGHRLDRRQTHHAIILQIGLRLAITQTDARPIMPVSFR